MGETMTNLMKHRKSGTKKWRQTAVLNAAKLVANGLIKILFGR